MDGPDILARSLSSPWTPDRYGNTWQYHSRSDRHSKVACCAIFFDLLQHSSVLRAHVRDSKIIFGVNHEMFDFKTGRRKKLDLVIARPGTQQLGKPAPRTLTTLIQHHGAMLSDVQERQLRQLPEALEGPVGTVLVALEAKATMTKHVGAQPRLYDELNSSHLTIHGASEQAVGVGFVMINIARTFISSDLNKFDFGTRPPVITALNQPQDAIGVYAKVREIPRRSRRGEEGFDALGVVLVDMPNDGAAVTVLSAPPAPAPNEPFHYDSMIRRTAHLYELSFSSI